MNKAVRCFAGIILGGLAGCIVVDGSRTDWVVDESPVETTGPGRGDARFSRWQRNKYEYNDGSKIAIGFFPGSGEMIDSGKLTYSKSQKLDSWGSYVFCTLFANCFVLPTIDSLFVEPLGDGEFSGCGLIGCHRWRGTGGTNLVKQGDPEEIVRSGFSNARPACFSEAYGKLEDGTKAYYLYPGFQRIEEDVKANGVVAVLFEGSSDRCRRFCRSKNVDEALGYHDEMLTSPVLVSEPMQSRLLACWNAPEVTIDEQAFIFLLLDNRLFADRKYQHRLAFVLSKTAHWSRVFDKVKSGGLTDADVIKSLALGSEYKGIGGGDGDETVGIWAVEKLSDGQRVDVVRNATLMSVRSNALDRIATAGNVSQVVLDTELPDELRRKAVEKILTMDAADCYKQLYIKSKDFWICQSVLPKLDEDARLDSVVSSKSIDWLRNGTLTEQELSPVAHSVVGDAALAQLALDRAVPRAFREMAVGKLPEKACCDVYCKAEEFWLGWAALAKIGADARLGKDVSSRSHRWLQDATAELSDRERIYLTLGSEPLAAGEQKVVAKMLELSDVWKDVLNKCSGDNSLTDTGIRLALAKQSYHVEEAVSLWAVDGLMDKDLLDVAGGSKSSRVGFKAVRLLKDRSSVESVALGKYSTVLRIEAINRLTAQSEETLRSIATSADANFRTVALERMKSLGLSMQTIQEEADAVAARERAARKAAEEKLRKERESAIGRAQREIELAKIDEAIAKYRGALAAGALEGQTLSFSGTILTIASKAWKPKIRIEIKGAKETLYALCRGSGRTDVELTVGCSVKVEGVFKTGTAAEVMLENARFETIAGGVK